MGKVSDADRIAETMFSSPTSNTAVSTATNSHTTADSLTLLKMKFAIDFSSGGEYDATYWTIFCPQ